MKIEFGDIIAILALIISIINLIIYFVNCICVNDVKQTFIKKL